MDDYRVKLPDFHGPLDLLLHLVKRNEIDVRDIPMAVVVEQFRTYIDVLQVIDMEWAGEFIVTASMLIEIKSKLLLPRTEQAATDDSIVEDPRTELVKQLLDYKRFRDAAARLEGRAAEYERRLARAPVASDDPAASMPTLVKAVELWDLLSAFGRLIHEAAEFAPDVVHEDVPQRVYREELFNRIAEVGRMTFRDAFTPPFHRLRLVGIFLALLELIKSGHVLVEGGEGDVIWVQKSPQTATSIT
ncbi:MAG: segregation and condensation protein A [Gemmataceae bacterium]